MLLHMCQSWLHLVRLVHPLTMTWTDCVVDGQDGSSNVCEPAYCTCTSQLLHLLLCGLHITLSLSQHMMMSCGPAVHT